MIKQFFLILTCLAFYLTPSFAQHQKFKESEKRLEQIRKDAEQKNREQELLKKLETFSAESKDPEKLDTYLKLAQFYYSKRKDSLKINALEHIMELAIPERDYEVMKLALAMQLYHYLMKFDTEKAAAQGEAMYDLGIKINNQEIQFEALTGLAGIYQKSDTKKFSNVIQRALQIAKTDFQKSFSYLNHATNLSSVNIDSSEYYYKLAYEYALLTNDSMRISATKRDFGSFLGRQSRTSESITNLLAALEYLPKGKRYDYSRIEILKTIAITYRSLEDYDKAIDYMDQAVAIAEKNNYKTTIGSSSRIYGEIYLAQEKFKLAQENFHTAYTYFQRSKNKNLVLASGSNLGLAYLKLGNYNKAQFLYDSLSHINIDKKEFGGPYYRYLRLGYSLDYYKGYYPAAIKKLTTVLDLIKILNLGKERIETLKALAMAHQKIGSLDKSNYFYQEAFLYRDSLFNSELINTSKELEAKYEAQKKEKEISFLNQDNLLKSKLLKQRTWALVVGGIALFIISMLLFSLYYYYRKVQSQNGLVNKALEEKDYLLREIHHRVKNNLQVVSSLLSLQSRQIEDVDIRKAIDEGRNRVRSMALIHQNLYQHDSLSGVSVSGYLDNLITELFDTYNISSEHISLNLDIEEIALDIDTMVPLGLIINELISNCLKHAFPENKKGEIQVKLAELNNQIHLLVKDNGIGIQTNKMDQSKSFGKKLIGAFSKKLHAEMTMINNNGTEVSMIIKKYKKAA